MSLRLPTEVLTDVVAQTSAIALAAESPAHGQVQIPQDAAGNYAQGYGFRGRLTASLANTVVVNVIGSAGGTVALKPGETTGWIECDLKLVTVQCGTGSQILHVMGNH